LKWAKEWEGVGGMKFNDFHAGSISLPFFENWEILILPVWKVYQTENNSF